MPCLTRGGIHPRTAQSLWALDIPDKNKRVVMFSVDRPTTSARSASQRVLLAKHTQGSLYSINYARRCQSA